MADQKVSEEQLPSAAEFEAAINRAVKENPEMVGPLLTTALLTCLKKFEEHEAKLNKIGPAVVLLWKKAGLGVPQAPAARANGTNGTAPLKPRTSAVGEPLSPEEASVEEMMDTAEVDNSQPTAGVAMAGQGPASPRAVKQRQQQLRQAGAQSAPLPPGTKVTGNDGAPLTPEEIEMERMMDEAPVEQ